MLGDVRRCFNTQWNLLDVTLGLDNISTIPDDYVPDQIKQHCEYNTV